MRVQNQLPHLDKHACGWYQRETDVVVPHMCARPHVPQGDAIFDSVKYMYPLGREGKVESTFVTEPECADAIARADAPLLQLM